ncbi:MAG: archease [Desulfomonilia bacterium]|jgi:SHS2 domain-containing protein
MPYTLIDHTADIGMRVNAKSIEGLFEEAAHALADILGGRSDEGDAEIIIETQGIDQVDLLVRWLQEILYLIEVKGLRLKVAAIRRLTDTEAQGVVRGAYTGKPLTSEIKAVTYHNLDIAHIDNAFVTTIILDM